MLEDTTISCPNCDTELHVKVVSGRKPIYIVENDCLKCKTKAESLEKKLNNSGKKWIKTEKSYIKLDPRG